MTHQRAFFSLLNRFGEALGQVSIRSPSPIASNFIETLVPMQGNGLPVVSLRRRVYSHTLLLSPSWGCSCIICMSAFGQAIDVAKQAEIQVSLVNMGPHVLYGVPGKSRSFCRQC